MTHQHELRLVRVVAPVALSFALWSGVSAAALAEPTSLEQFASDEDAVITSTTPVGSLDSAEANVSVVALVVTDPAHPTVARRGVRFDFATNNASDQVYLDEDQVRSMRNDLTGLEEGMPWLEEGDGAPSRAQGTAACWMPEKPIRILCPEYYVGPNGSGLTLGAYGGMVFAFPNRKPAELATLVDLALVQLEQH
jgi:hypothetical protein